MGFEIPGLGALLEEGRQRLLGLDGKLDDSRERLVHIEHKLDALAGRAPAARSTVPDYAPELVNNPNPALGPYALKLLSLIKPRDVVGKSLVRIGRDFDGGYVMLDDGLNNAVVYSLGISDDVSWDLEMARRGCTVFQYDHTIDRFPAEHPRFHSFKIGIEHRESGNPMMKTIDELIEINRHRDQHDIVLKMDIEFSEWKVFEEMPEATLQRFRQITMEVHRLTELEHTEFYRRFVNVLQKLNRTHQSIHVHGNNCGRIALIGGVALPDSLELTYVRSSDYSFAECRKVFPTELDMPNNHTRADYYLGPLGML
jgi:hypothetical protein